VRRSGPAPAWTPTERQVVAAAVQSPGIAGALEGSCRELPEFGERCRSILAWIRDRAEEGVVDAPGLLSRASEDEALWRGFSFLHEDVEAGEEVPPDLLRNLRKRVLARRKRELTDQIRRAEERGEEIQGLQEEKQRLAAALRDLDAAEPLSHGNFP
jgi:hypothetical protein